MAVPRSRISNSRRKKRRAHDAKEPLSFTNCPNCNNTTQPHRMCGSCGYYKGKSIQSKEKA